MSVENWAMLTLMEVGRELHIALGDTLATLPALAKSRMTELTKLRSKKAMYLREAEDVQVLEELRIRLARRTK